MFSHFNPLSNSSSHGNRRYAGYTSSTPTITHYPPTSGDSAGEVFSQQWKTSPGEFSCKSFFEILFCSSLATSFPQFNTIWKNGVPTKIKVFAWLATLGKVNTCDKVQVRRPSFCLSPSWSCLCKRSAEIIDHILLHCEFVSDIWVKIVNIFGVVGAFPQKWANFTAIKWQVGKKSKKVKALWRFSVLALAWAIWIEKNRRVFEDRCSHAKEIWSCVQFLVGLWAKASKIFDSTDAFLFNLSSDSFLDC